MNDVVFVMANSRLMKKKGVRKTKDYNIDDIAFDDEWTLEENEANSSYTLDNDILLEVGENEEASRVGVAAYMNDLEVPLIAHDDEGHGRDDIRNWLFCT
ncbi:hypothetical protein PHAVU_004G071025 [Phaseolus vulgaris]